MKDPDTGKSNASVGTGTIDTGQTQVVVKTTKFTAGSLIFVTPTTKTDKVLSVTTKVDKESFTVEINSPVSSDTSFDRIIIN